MSEQIGLRSSDTVLSEIGLKNFKTAYWNLDVPHLVTETLFRKQGMLTDTGALAIDTGEFTGRSPKDKFVVKDSYTESTVWWGDVNHPFDPKKFDALHQKMLQYFEGKDVFVRDAYACADPKYRLNIRVINETPWANLFSYNLFLRPTKEEIKNFQHDWVILNAPGFKANATEDGTRQHNFTIINFSKKIILIGGSAYTGEIKKSVFTILNYILPHEKNVLSMHCSANVGKKGDTAIFFGLSGTGKTTLSSDPERQLIGDDEHGWSDEKVFNFEGGCYAKCVNLSKEKEPQIFNAIKFGALLENTRFFPDTSTVNYDDISVTENTRVSYPLHYIDNALIPSVGSAPKNIFFLTCDAYGVFPPISKLNINQAMYYFISGYTAKVAGTEMGITEPTATFSACFGKAFLPLHPAQYAKLFGEKLKKDKINVWLINTGWIAGGAKKSKRMNLSYTREMIHAALSGELDKAEYEKIPFFHLEFPKACRNIPYNILNPRASWPSAEEYDAAAYELAKKFIENFKEFEDLATQDMINAGPHLEKSTVI
ncbi:MAG: phosphoenolpyruvate carboxykinase (ATP) [Bacteroidia bacterium]|nr:phosphoenolpyruvate carboxykinase (ATP) [Bacteroidia bacterium]